MIAPTKTFPLWKAILAASLGGAVWIIIALAFMAMTPN